MTASINYDEQFARLAARLTDVYGDTARQWIAGLPALLTECEQRWDIELQPSFSLSYNYVAPAVRVGDGARLVLKAGVPGPELQSESKALAHFAGRGSVRLLDADAALGVMLLERIEPGTMLVDVPDDVRQTEIAAGVMRELWRPLDDRYSFRSVADWGMRLRYPEGRGFGPLPRALAEAAAERFAALLETSAPPVLLHGDLHHMNILRHGDGWVAIDPKGITGEPAYETGAFLRNPTPDLAAWPDLRDVLARRIDQLAGLLALDRQRILGWAMAQAVLSALWTIDDHGTGWEPAAHVAKTLLDLERSAS